jgi:hypothetical protein
VQRWADKGRKMLHIFGNKLHYSHFMGLKKARPFVNERAFLRQNTEGGLFFSQLENFLNTYPNEWSGTTAKKNVST